MNSLLAGVYPFHVLHEASLEMEVCPLCFCIVLGRVRSEGDGSIAIEEGQFSEPCSNCFWIY